MRHINFWKRIIFTGAQKGLLTLFYTYDFDIVKTIKNGVLEYLDHLGQIRTFSTHENMNIKEYQKLVDLAIEKNNYAAAILLIRVSRKEWQWVEKYTFYLWIVPIDLAGNHKH